MPNEIIKIQKEITALQKKYDKARIKNEHLALDLKKAKLDVQEERLKYERRIFQLKEKCTCFKSELNELKHKVSLSHSENEDVCQKMEKLKTELKPRDIEPLSSDPL
jgi:chromosome segregation ATPase